MSALDGLEIVRTGARAAIIAEDWPCWAGRRELGAFRGVILVLRKL